jgi:hypothetical protein
MSSMDLANTGQQISNCAFSKAINSQEGFEQEDFTLEAGLSEI